MIWLHSPNGRYHDPQARLNALEEATDVGSWTEAIDHHEQLIQHYTKEVKFEEALEQVKSLRAIYEKDKFAFGDALQELSVREARIEKIAQLAKHGISAQVHISEGNHNVALESAVGLLELSKDLEFPEEYIRALEATRSVCESMFTENFKGEGAISAMPRKEYRKALDSLLQSSRDNPEAIKQFPAAAMEFMENYKVMQEATQNGNHDLAHLQVDKLLELNKKYTIHLIKDSDLEELRTLTIGSRDWKRALEPCRDAVSSQRFRDLPSLLADLTIQHTSGAFPGIIHAELANLDSEVSTATCNALMRLWETAFDSTDYTTCLTHLSTMQSLQDRGLFATNQTSVPPPLSSPSSSSKPRTASPPRNMTTSLPS